jgi:transcriptional regulator with XRE-family HTH domain
MSTTSTRPATAVGAMLRDWREDRRRSQLALALDVGVSTRHLSFVETGKARPSPELVLAIAEHLDVPRRERNAMLLAAGYAPRYAQTALHDAAMANVQRALATLLRAHDPYPAVVVDRWWDVLLSNSGAQRLLVGVAATLLGPPLNVYRVSLHPDGMAAHIDNFAEWAHHLLATLARQVAVTRDRRLQRLLEEVTAYPNVAALGTSWRTRDDHPELLVPLRITDADGTTLSWFSTNTSIGTPVDITLEELHVELFHPADERTASVVGGAG